jgi:hypothetical protein
MEDGQLAGEVHGRHDGAQVFLGGVVKSGHREALPVASVAAMTYRIIWLLVERFAGMTAPQAVTGHAVSVGAVVQHGCRELGPEHDAIAHRDAADVAEGRPDAGGHQEVFVIERHVGVWRTASMTGPGKAEPPRLTSPGVGIVK